MRLLFTVTIFLSSALLFLAQPMAAKVILPQFGGSSAVWTTSVLFFQSALLLGYWLAHRMRSIAATRAGPAILFALLLVSSAVSTRPGLSTGFPVGDVLLTLLLLVGTPFAVLSMCSPLIQRFFSATNDANADNPYFLYAASNLGSMSALLAYPFLVEPLLTLDVQMTTFRGGVLVTALAMLGLYRYLPARGGESAGTSQVRPSARQMTLWIALAAVPSSLMLGLTTFATTNIAPVPLFWVGPLALYLLTYVVAFSASIRVGSSVWARLLPIVVTPLAMLLVLESNEPFAAILVIHGLAFSVAALMCHTRLAEARPPAESLTYFYLCVAIGGAVGGFFNAIVAPLVFATVAEYSLAIVAACLMRGHGDWTKASLVGAGMFALTAVIAVGARIAELPAAPLRTGIVVGVPVIVAFLFSRRPARYGLAIGAVLLAAHFLEVGSDSRVAYADRSFYGVHRVLESSGGRFMLLAHGTTLHGIQDRENPKEPLTYYTRNSPIGEVFAAYDFEHVGLVGLGVGSCAAFGKEGRRMTFFEIDPVVVRIAQDDSLFTFLRDSRADIKIVQGDARLTLAESEDGEFGMLVLDAFSSDAIPMHLLTREAMSLYLSKIHDGGIVALHISNRMLELEPIVARIAESLGVTCLALEAWPSEKQHADGMRPSIWAVIVREPGVAALLRGWRPATPRPETPLWTDDYSNILSAWRTE